MPDPERFVRVTATEKGRESFAIDHDPERLPDDPEKVAEFLHRNLLEISTHKITGKGELSEEAEFVERLEAAMADFYKERGSAIPLERRPSLSYLQSVLDGSLETLLLPPEELRALMAFVRERFDVPERADLTILEGETPVKNQPGRIDAHRRLLEGITSSWARLIEVSWRTHYAETFPARIKAELEDIALLEDSPGEQRTLMQTLVSRFEKASPYRFRRFLKALIDLSAEGGNIEVKGQAAGRSVVTAPDLKALAAYVAARLPEERTPGGKEAAAEELFAQMAEGAREKGGTEDKARMSKESLGLLIEGFAHDIRAVHELASLDYLYNNESPSNPNFIFNEVRRRWDTFSPAQQASFIDLVRANFALVPPKGGDGAKKRPNRKEQARVELSDLCKDIARDLRKPGAKISEARVKELASLIKFRADEIADYRTRPEAEQEQAEEAVENAAPQSPEVMLREIREALVHPRAYAAPLVRLLVREDMKAARKALLKEFLDVFGSTEEKKVLVTRVQLRAHREVSEQEVTALQTVIDSGGESTNKTGWEILLVVGNGYSQFRARMAQGA